jgi:serine/threonine-protein kinase
MEYLDGLPLTNIVEAGKPVPVARILDIARQLAEGLHAAHESGIVHRDLKPDNIFLIERGHTKDFVKILDFGIAKVSTSGEGRLTRAGAVFGTPHYMSPEQAAGAPVDHRGDIYSFGVILYELASGKVPFDADNFMGILTQHMYKAPVPIRALVPAPQEVPPGLEAIVLKCLSKRPEQRYQSMNELLADVDKMKSGAIPDAVPEMMGRSGGFNVPADYFKKSAGMPAPVPASPLSGGIQRTRWPLYAGVAGVLTAMVIVIAIFTASSKSTAETSPSATGTGAAAIAAPPKPELTTKPASPPTVRKAQVVVAVEPSDAQIFQNGEENGVSPLLLQVPEGESIKLEIKREGYKDQTVEVDGSKQKLVVKLAKVPGAGRSYVRPAPVTQGPKPKPKPKPRPTITDPGLVNPWGE